MPDQARTTDLPASGRAAAIQLRVQAWSLRLLVFAALGLLCRLAGSAKPAIAFALAWVPNYPLLGAVMTGVLRLPRGLERVHPFEPPLYRWFGVGLVKWIVTSRAWLLLVAFAPPAPPPGRRALLERIEAMTRGAELCHGMAFLFAATVALLSLSSGTSSMALWILGFNVALNAYPIMLQRSIRWRVGQARTGTTGQ